MTVPINVTFPNFMHILFLIHFPPPIHGASAIGGFIKESKVINSGFYCHHINIGTSVSVEDIGRNSIKKLLRYISLIWQVKRQLVTHRPDLCYFTPTAAGPGFYKDALLIAIVKLFRIKTVFHYHNKGVRGMQGHLFDNFLYRMAFKNTSVILLSKHLYLDLEKYVPENRVYYCPNGIPDIEDKRHIAKDDGTIGEQSVDSGGTEKFGAMRWGSGGTKDCCNKLSISRPFAQSPPQNINTRGIVKILFLSHLIRSKGVLVLIDACRLLKEKGVNFHCTMAGGDAELTKQELKAIVYEKGLSSFVSVVGQKHGEEKSELLNSADIFAHPSYNDCLPLVLLESMQHSLAIVSTFEGAIPDVVDNGVTGFIVPQRDAPAFADKLEILIKDPDLRVKMGAAGRAKYEREFTLERFEHRIKDILEEIGRD